MPLSSFCDNPQCEYYKYKVRPESRRLIASTVTREVYFNGLRFSYYCKECKEELIARNNTSKRVPKNVIART